MSENVDDCFVKRVPRELVIEPQEFYFKNIPKEFALKGFWKSSLLGDKGLSAELALRWFSHNFS